MTPSGMAERPIEALSPEWIGLMMEVEDEGGTTVGFRLGRYERTAVDGKPMWRLFSDQPAWSVTLYAGTKLRCVLPAPTVGSQIVAYPQRLAPDARPAPQVSQYPVSAPPRPAVRSPQSWVNEPPRR